MIVVDKTVDFFGPTISQSVSYCWGTYYWGTRRDVDTLLSKLREALPEAWLLIERSECWPVSDSAMWTLPEDNRIDKFSFNENRWDPSHFSSKNNRIDKLRSQLKDSVYEAESIFAELEYQRSTNKIKQSFPGINFKRKWMSNFPINVKRVLDRLNDVCNEMTELCAINDIPENPNKFRPNAKPVTSRYDTSYVYGLKEKITEVIRLVGVPSSESHPRKRGEKVNVSNLDIGESSSRIDNKWNVSVLSIVGMGGVGKTTLAQQVCIDNSVKGYFEPIMWVQVGDNFDSVRLTKKIIESATTEVFNLPELDLDPLQVALGKTLNSKRFLLVLDDVWSKDWHSLLGPMEGASEGSTVLVTTRFRDCVEIQGTNINSRGVINVEGLEKDIYWEFFKSRAFYSVAESNNINPELVVIGREICDKLKGSPLAAKTIGDLLGNKLDVAWWTKIKDSKIWELPTKKHDILPVLQLSYQCLPSHLKKCLSFCSLYPKGFQFTQCELTMCWIMQGLIKPLVDIQQLRSLAEGYFRFLVKRRFFQKVARDAYDKNDEYAIHDENDLYVIHDLMHVVCQSITKDECFCLENGYSEQNVSPNIRHVSVFTDTLKENELCKYKKLLSLELAFSNSCSELASSNSCSIAAMTNWCNELTNIRSLSLRRCNINALPQNIGNLKLLHFLDISDADVEALPESFCSLYNLQYLNMNDCSKIKCFPKGFNNLVNLLLFKLPLEKVPLVEHIENIFEAIQLCDLRVVVPHQKIENLKKIHKLSGYLEISHLENVPSRNAAKEAQLNEKPLINRLDLVWSRSERSTTEPQDEEVLHGLRPHSNLKELRITNYFGKQLSPSWLQEYPFPNLTEVHCEYCEFSTISGLPRSITKLIIRGCAHLTNFQNCLEPNHLRALKHIKIEDCGELVSLSVESFGGFESLEWLTIASCPKLKSQNGLVLPPSVKDLELRSCGDLEESIPGCLQNLTSLKTLSISDCQKMVSIPAEATSNLKSLSELCFENCSKLQSLGGLQFLSSLQKVTIRSCPELDETRGQDINGKLPSELLEDMPLSSQDRKRRRRRA